MNSDIIAIVAPYGSSSRVKLFVINGDDRFKLFSRLIKIHDYVKIVSPMKMRKV